MSAAQFRFHGDLRQFYPLGRKGEWVPFSVTQPPAVKDAIEALGVPHVEVGAILLNGQSVSFSAKITAGAVVEVFPYGQVPPEAIGVLPPLQPPGELKFALDVHLGTLARSLRLLGFDTFYEREQADQALALLARQEQRVLLTRDVGLLKHRNVTWGYFLRSQQPQEQLLEVVERYRLQSLSRPFSRCLVCNGAVVPLAKEEVLHRLPPKTVQYFQEFFTCTQCGRVYWKGSHYDRMVRFLQRL